MNLSLIDVVQVLQVGLSGLAFLLAYLGFKLLAEEQKAKEPRPAILRSSRNFMYQCIGLAIIVGLFQLIPEFLPERLDKEQLAACRDSMDLLEERVQRAEKSEHLVDAIRDHQARCSQLIVSLDENQ